MPALVIAIAAVVSALLGGWALQSQSRVHVLVASFWFDQGPFAIQGFTPAQGGGALTPEELVIVEAQAWSELRAAFAGLRVRFTADHGGMYRVQVVQTLARVPWSPFRRGFAAAGESRAVRPIGGRGAVSFGVLADNAVAYAPKGATRAMTLAGIGRGVGRAAAHEFAHQFFPSLQIHDSRDVGSYEYGSAGRAEQYYGEMHWDLAWPLLVERFGTGQATTSRAEP